jgi:hypothetical protein
MRYGLFVHDPDGDMGYGLLVGKFRTEEAADAKAASIRRQNEAIEVIVLPMVEGGFSSRRIAEEVMS